MPPCWMGYLGVNDVDRAVAGITKAGGTTYMEPLDIENVGKMMPWIWVKLAATSSCATAVT